MLRIKSQNKIKTEIRVLEWLPSPRTLQSTLDGNWPGIDAELMMRDEVVSGRPITTGYPTCSSFASHQEHAGNSTTGASGNPMDQILGLVAEWGFGSIIMLYVAPVRQRRCLWAICHHSPGY